MCFYLSIIKDMDAMELRPPIRRVYSRRNRRETADETPV